MAQARTTALAGMPAQNTPNLESWTLLREGEAYMVTLGHLRELYLFKETNGRWTLWWGQWTKDGGEKPIKEKTLESRMTFDAAVSRGNSYLDWWRSRD